MRAFRDCSERRSAGRLEAGNSAESRGGTGHGRFAFERRAGSGKAFRRLRPRTIVAPSPAEVGAALNTWTPVATNVAFSGSFNIPTDVNPQGFYRIISE